MTKDELNKLCDLPKQQLVEKIFELDERVKALTELRDRLQKDVNATGASTLKIQIDSWKEQNSKLYSDIKAKDEAIHQLKGLIITLFDRNGY